MRWTRFDAFAVTTERGATLLLSPNSDVGVPTAVHIDEIAVPESYRKTGAATEALVALCKLADKHQFLLVGGPIGWSEAPWRDKFIKWMFRFEFERDPSPFLLPIDDPLAFYVRRLPTNERFPQRLHCSSNATDSLALACISDTNS